MKTKKKINWGIIGAGHIANKFAECFALVPDAQLIAVASTDLARAEIFAVKHNIPHFFGNYTDILNCPDLDVIYIATTNDQHAPNTLMCLEHGIAVLCEKPFALNKKQVQLMIEKAREKNVFLMEAMWSCFVPGLQKALSIVESGELGAPILVKADFGGFFPFDADKRIYNKSLGGGALLDIGIYPVVLAQLIFGKYKKIKISAAMNALTGVDDTCAMHLEYDNGGMAVLNASVKAKMQTEAWIFCEKGYVHLPPRFHHPKKFEIGLYNGKNPETIRSYKTDYKSWGYQYQIKEVNHCLQQGKIQSDIVSHAFSLELIETLDAARKEMGLVYPQD